jgi:glycogen(starch) synthase
MRLLITADTVGGVWTYARELVTGLLRRGHQITLVSFGAIPSAQQTRWMEGLQHLDFRPTGYRLEWMQEAEQDVTASMTFLQSVIAEVKPDVLHFNQFCYGAIPTDIPKVVVAHSDVVSWWVEVHGEQPPNSAWMRWYRQVVSDGLAAATAAVAPSQWMLENVSRYFAPAQRCLVIYNGRSPELFDPDIAKEDAVLSVGRLWDAGKQISLLLDAGIELPVWVAGDSGDDDLRWRHAAVRFYRLLGEAEMRDLFARASIYAAVSRYEPFGLALVEAALSNCAVAANDIPTFREIWGDSVVYFRRNDASALKAAILRLQSDDHLRREYAGRACEHARNFLNADHMVQQYINLYEQLTAKPAAMAMDHALGD